MGGGVGIPAVLGAGDLSITRTSWPLRRHSSAVVKPPTPAPTIRQEMPVGGWNLTFSFEMFGRSLSRSMV